MNPQSEKEIRIQERIFKVKKFTPQTGCYWAFKVFGSMMGGGLSGQNQAGRIQLFVQSLVDKPDEFSRFHSDCLSSVSELLPVGRVPVIDENGNYAVMNVSGPLVFHLLLESFTFSLMDFFTEELLTGLSGTLASVMGMETINESINSSIPQSSMDTGSSMNSGMEPTASQTGLTS